MKIMYPQDNARNIFRTIGKILLTTIIIVFDFQLLSSPQPWIFIDGANLLFHEAGHLIFSPFGMFMHILGGSLMQCLLPTVVTAYFLRTKQHFSSAFGVFWLGDNLINVSVYIKDARAMVLPLLGGDGAIHDWHWLLDTTNLLPFDQDIGNIVFAIGAFFLFASTIIMLYLACRPFIQKASAHN